MPILLQTTTPLLKVACGGGSFEFWILDFLNFFVCTWASWAEGEVEVVGHGHIGTFPQKGNSETSAEKRGSLLQRQNKCRSSPIINNLLQRNSVSYKL